MKAKSILIICDNEVIRPGVEEIIHSEITQNPDAHFTVMESYEKFSGKESPGLDLKKEEAVKFIIKNFDLIISAHARQIFPAALFNKIPCFNLHPGFNPLARGWYPHVFSIIKKIPAGATLHVINGEIDNGPIIDRQEVAISEEDTSETLYNRILKTELNILKDNLNTLINGTYKTWKPAEKSSLPFLRKDFKDLCKLDLKESGTFEEFYDRLRATTHGEFRNAYFLNSKGEKVYVSIKIKKDEQTAD